MRKFVKGAKRRAYFSISKLRNLFTRRQSFFLSAEKWLPPGNTHITWPAENKLCILNGTSWIRVKYIPSHDLLLYPWQRSWKNFLFFFWKKNLKNLTWSSSPCLAGNALCGSFCGMVGEDCDFGSWSSSHPESIENLLAYKEVVVSVYLGVVWFTIWSLVSGSENIQR